MWKGGLNEGLKKEGRVMGRKEERKDYKGKKKKKGRQRNIEKKLYK